VNPSSGASNQSTLAPVLDIRPSASVTRAGLAIALAVGAYVGANVLELAVVRIARPSVFNVIEISDGLLAAAMGVVTYLWLHLRATRTELQRVEREHIVVSTQLATAAEIQRRLLPAEAPSTSDLTCAVRFEPAWEIGGDFYDFLPAGPGAMFIIIGDISGKGIPAAMLLAFTRGILRMGVGQTTDPGEVLALLSKALYDDNEGSPYATCLVARVDTAGRSLTYSNAGHPPGIVAGRGGVHVLDRGGPPAGMFRSPGYVSETISFDPGDLGVFVTDGISEQDVFDRPAGALLAALVAETASPRTPGRVCDTIMSYGRRAGGPAGVENWIDDRTVVSFRA
jgi:phosphoserine phosphatase RsbU/P